MIISSVRRVISRPGTGQAWLKAGVIDGGRFAPTERGSPQGGVISPVLMNVALHGMEGGRRGSGTSFPAATPGRRGGLSGSCQVPDDCWPCATRGAARAGQGAVAAWLAPGGCPSRGQDRIVHLDDGGGLPGIQRPRYRGKLLIKPSKAAAERSGAADHRDESPARAQRAGGPHPAQTPSSGLSRLLPACGVGAEWFNELTPRVDATTSGRSSPIAQGKALDYRPGTSARSLGQRDRWVFGDARAAPTCSSSPG